MNQAMNKAVRLTPLKDYAGKVENDAARRLAACAQALSAKEKEVAQLRGYLAEYRRRAELADAATDPMRWQNTRTFLAKLSELVQSGYFSDPDEQIRRTGHVKLSVEFGINAELHA